MNPFQAVFLERQRIEKWRAGGEWMNGRTKIMEVARKRKLKGARRAARLRLGFKDINAHASLREDDRGREAVGAGADDAGSVNHVLAHRRSGSAPLLGNSGVQEFSNRLRRPAV